MLKVKFWRIKHLVIAEIVDQDESLRGMDEYTGSNGFKIASDKSPKIATITLYIRGNCRTRDHDLAMLDFIDEDSAKWYVKEMSKTITEFNKLLKSKQSILDIADIEITTAF